MALEMLEDIRKTEEKAEKVRSDAQREGREIIKAVEEACAVAERHARADHRTVYQNMMESRRKEIERAILSGETGREAARKKVCEAAENKLSAAVPYIFERIVSHGSR